MFPNWTGWKTVKLVLATLAAAAGGIGAAGLGGVSTDAVIVGTVLSALTGVVVVFSGTAAGPKMVRP